LVNNFLNSPLIIQTYSLEPYQNGYALVMEDFGGISLKNHYNLSLALHELATETAYMSVNFEQIEKWADIVLGEGTEFIIEIPV
jgi:predicted ATPase